MKCARKLVKFEAVKGEVLSKLRGEGFQVNSNWTRVQLIMR